MFIILIIEHLADHKEYIDTVTNWIWKELIKNKLPLTFSALEDNELVGTIGLWRSRFYRTISLY
ncbi:MAG: GCN5-related N-acetyltransferase [Clostridiaceae bacterium]|nr:GCN5-related N-acetyltransferase [Clostridiaceae bacterium]